jgi:hypothetical protein
MYLLVYAVASRVEAKHGFGHGARRKTSKEAWRSGLFGTGYGWEEGTDSTGYSLQDFPPGTLGVDGWPSCNIYYISICFATGQVLLPILKRVEKRRGLCAG